MIFKITKLFAKNLEDQKDLYQEIVYQLWKSFDSFEGKSKLSTWIYKIGLNTSITHQNKQRKYNNKFPHEATLSKIVHETDQLMETQIKWLYEMIKTLPLTDRGIILLFLEGLNYDSIAEIVGISSTNVGTRLNRIKAKFKTKTKEAELWN